MPSYKILPNGKAFASIDVLEGYIEYEYGSEPQELLDAINLKTFDETFYDWVEGRRDAIKNLEISYSDVIYEADEIAQSRMLRAIKALEIDQELGGSITTVDWVAKDDTIHTLNINDLKKIFRDSTLLQATMWNVDRPTE